MKASRKLATQPAAEQWLAAGEAADRRAHEARAARAKALLEENERSGAHDRLRNLDLVHRRLLGRTRDALVSQALVLVARMIDDLVKAPDHNYDPSDRARLVVLLREIEDKEQKQASKAMGAQGGRTSADAKKKFAKRWHDVIRAEVERRILAGETNVNIAAALSEKVHKAPTTIERYVATVRRGEETSE